MKPSPTLWLSSLVTQPSRYRSFIEGKGNKGFNVTERSVSLEMVPQVSWGRARLVVCQPCTQGSWDLSRSCFPNCMGQDTVVLPSFGE